jgi:hypothetical protein
MKFSMTVEGEKVVLGQLRTLDLATQTEARKSIRKSGNRLQRKMRSRMPAKTGKARKSVKARYFDQGMRALVGSTWYVARFLEHGTKPHKIKTKRAKALETDLGMFANNVDHPGIPARPWLAPSWAEEKPRYVKEMKDALNRASRKAERG